MNIWTISDLHLKNTNPDQFGRRLKIPSANICALPGDICDDLEAGIRWVAAIIAPHMPVVMVLGNHDLFGNALSTATKKAREIALDAVIKRDVNGNPILDAEGNIQRHHPIFVLDDDVELILPKHGVRFIGSTMWTDFSIMAGDHDDKKAVREQALADMKTAMPEYHNVYLDEVRGNIIPRLMRPVDAYACHVASREALIKKLEKPFVGKTVVMTHHAPSPQSISTFFGKNKLTPGFVSNMEDIMLQYEPDLWLHGHVHDSFNYRVGRTQVFCHAQGGNPKFSWQSGIIDLPTRKQALTLGSPR